MSAELTPKTVLPAELAVYVCDVRTGNQLWPLLRVDKRQDGHVSFTSGAANAPLGLAVLKDAFELCLSQTAMIAQKKKGEEQA